MLYVPEELVTEILLRLPVKSLMKCLCVCKDWYDLIKSSRFVHLHLNHPSSNKNREEYMIFGQERIGYFSFDKNGTLLPMPDPLHLPVFDAVQVCGPCNGIFCIVGTVLSLSTTAEEYIILCNPATRESHRLPKRPLTKFPCHIRACGLGFDSHTNDYKFLSLLNYLNGWNPGYHIMIYNLSSNSWKEVEMALPISVNLKFWIGSGLLFNGRLHWRIWYSDVILWFDISSEIFGHDLIPPNVGRTNLYSSQQLLVLEDCLAFAVVATPAPAVNDGTSSIIIWKRVDCGAKESWIKRFSISLPFQGWLLQPVSFSKDDVLLLLDNLFHKLVSVNLRKVDGWRVKAQTLLCLRDFIMLKESLVSFR